MKKRLLSLFLLLTLLLSLVGCGTDPVDSAAGNAATTTTVTTASAVGEGTTTTAANAPTTTTVTASTESEATDGTTAAAKPTTTATKAPTVTKAPTTTATTARPTTTTTTASAADKALVDRAFALAQGAKIENATLTGIVTSSQGYSEGYNNATFDLQVEGTNGTKTIYCYRVKPADSARTAVAVGDRLSLTGTIQNYKGTIEFYPAEYTHLAGGGVVVTTTRPTNSGSATIDEDGIYDS